MYIVLEIEGKRYSISATEILPEVKGAPDAAPKKETVQQRAEAVKASAAVGAPGPAPEKAEIPAELPKATRKRGAAAAAATPTTSVAQAVEAAVAAQPTSGPTPAQIDSYRLKFIGLVKGLEAAGATPKGDVAVGKRLKALLLKFSKVESTDQLTGAQWDAFFAKTDGYATAEGGLATLVAKLP